jgi:hypothetical protein
MSDLSRRLRGLAMRVPSADDRNLAFDAAAEIEGLTHDIGRALEGLTVEAL